MDKTVSKVKNAVSNFIVKYQWLVGTAVTAGLATYVVLKEPATTEAPVQENPVDLPTLNEYAKEEEADVFSTEGLMSLGEKMSNLFKKDTK